MDPVPAIRHAFGPLIRAGPGPFRPARISTHGNHVDLPRFHLPDSSCSVSRLRPSTHIFNWNEMANGGVYGVSRRKGPTRIRIQELMAHETLPTDDELLDGTRRGDERAFRRLVERYEGKVAATVVRMLGNGADVDDAGQETFIRFYRSIDKFRGEASIGTYLTRIAINQSLKVLKRRQTWSERFFSRDRDDTDSFEPSVEGGEALDERERARLVHDALQHLVPEQRAVVVLRILEGYSTRETAQMLGVPQGTVMSRLSRALEKLEQMLVPLL
jgi:RNA polymerase sigma-70 factor, ECF subfamily